MENAYGKIDDFMWYTEKNSDIKDNQLHVFEKSKLLIRNELKNEYCIKKIILIHPWMVDKNNWKRTCSHGYYAHQLYISNYLNIYCKAHRGHYEHKYRYVKSYPEKCPAIDYLKK